MDIFSHRGIGFGLKENSVEAFKECLENRFSIEVDVQKTSDNELVMFHNEFIVGLNGNTIRIMQSTFNEIKDSICSFSSLLDIFSKYDDNLKMAIHVKDENQDNILELVCREIADRGLINRCFIFDVTMQGANKIKSINQSIMVGISVSEKRYSKTIYLWEDLEERCCDIVWWDEWGKEKLYTKKSLEKIKNTQKKVYAISPELHKVHFHPMSGDLSKIKGLWKNLIYFEVDGICTDYPIEFRKILSAKDI